MKKIVPLFLIAVFFVPAACWAADFSFTGTKSGRQGKIRAWNQEREKVCEKTVYKQKIGARAMEFSQKGKAYVATVPVKKTNKRRGLKVYRFYGKKLKFEKVAFRKIAINKKKMVLGQEDIDGDDNPEILVRRKCDRTTYRIFDLKPKKGKLKRTVRRQKINIGMGRLYPVWGDIFKVQVPFNRPSWAMATALAEELASESGADVSANDIFSMAVKESKLGCDVNATGVAFVPASVASGCFQFQGPGPGTAWEEMQKIFPERFAGQSYGDLAPGARYETSAILLAYYLDFARGMMDHRDWQADEFISGAADPRASTAIWALAYNKSMWDADLTDIMADERSKCLAAADLSDCVDDAGGRDYVKSVSDYSAALAVANEVYDEEIYWENYAYFLERIAPLYPDADFRKIKKRTRNVHEFLKKEGEADFRNDFYSLLQIMMENFPPLEDPGGEIDRHYQF